jgi:ribA/ribD-fused uncharacterized protein
MSSTPIVYFSRSKDAKARALSNFALSWFQLDGRWWPTVEHYYQAHKWPSSMRDFFSSDSSTRAPAAGIDALQVKKLSGKGKMKAKKVTIHPAFELHKVEYMRAALDAKYALPEFRQALLDTGSRPLHHFGRRPSLWDCNTDHSTGKVKKGDNLHGQLLEQTRDKIKLQLHA